MELMFLSDCYRCLACSMPLFNPGSEDSQWSSRLDHLFLSHAWGRQGEISPTHRITLRNCSSSEWPKKWIGRQALLPTVCWNGQPCFPQTGCVLSMMLSANIPGQGKGPWLFLPTSLLAPIQEGRLAWLHRDRFLNKRVGEAMQTLSQLEGKQPCPDLLSGHLAVPSLHVASSPLTLCVFVRTLKHDDRCMFWYQVDHEILTRLKNLVKP